MIGRVLLDRYRVTRFLAEGGMSRVYLARQLDAERDVAVKVLHAAESRDGLRREMRLLRRIRHPNAVALYDADLDAAEPYLVLEYVEGETLAALLTRHGRLTPARVGRLLGQLCGVLQTAHDLGLVLRDLKPENVMVVRPDAADETIKLLDFGLATAAGGNDFDAADLRGARNALSGTPEYLCPEAILGNPVDARGDLYSLGVMLFEMLTGRRPFDRGKLDATLLAHVCQAPRPFEGEDVPRGIQQVVYACLAKFPAERPQNALELANRYEAALGERIDVPPPLGGAKGWASESDLLEDEPGPDDVVYRMTAWMPEAIALMKLRGCLPDLGGEVVETMPGALRIRLARPLPAGPPAKVSLWARMGFGKKPEPLPTAEWVAMDLRMRHVDAAEPNRLAITAVLHPPASSAEGPEDWRAFCDRIRVNLSAYLMARNDQRN